jgi:mRNA-degrading endonuclease RelE of RelBE toxin-antitoxin system
VQPRKVRLEPAAQRALAAIEPDDARRILDALQRLAREGVGDVKKLQAQHPARWRLRVGRYRAIFAFASDTISVFAIADRRDAYR